MISEAAASATEISMFEEEDNDADLVYDTRVSNCLFSQLMVAEFCSVFFAMLGIVLSVLIYEIRRTYGSEYNYAIDYAVNCNLACTICLILSLYIRYDVWL